MLAAPLIAGNDISNMSEETRAILTNKEAIAVDQDSLGIQAFKYSANGGVEVWFKPLMNNDWAMCVLNRTARPQKINFDWAKEKVKDDLYERVLASDKTVYTLRDLWTKKDIGTTEKMLDAEVPGHDVLMLRLSGK
jgi:alpha-galactosidase